MVMLHSFLSDCLTLEGFSSHLLVDDELKNYGM
jgi:hypothetical protein